MNFSSIDFLWLLFRATLVLCGCSAFAAITLRILTVKSARIHRIVWFVVLIQGAMFLRYPVEIVWWEATEQPAAMPATEVVVLDPPASDLVHPSNNIVHHSTLPKLSELLEADEATAKELTPPSTRIPEASDSLVHSEFAEPEVLVASASVKPIDTLPASRSAFAAVADFITSEAFGIIVIVAWIGGMIAFVLRWLLSYMFFLRHSREQLPCDESWEMELQKLVGQIRIDSDIRLYVTAKTGPALARVGGGYRVFVPQKKWGELSKEQRFAILEHELMHYRRGDMWKSLLFRLFAVVHWFNWWYDVWKRLPSGLAMKRRLEMASSRLVFTFERCWHWVANHEKCIACCFRQAAGGFTEELNEYWKPEKKKTLA
jgi:Zn-dependent protease with chaperone function